MQKLIMLFLIVFIYEKSFSQTCRTEDPNAMVDYPAELGDALDRGFKGISGEAVAIANGRRFNWGTVNETHLGINIQVNYYFDAPGFINLAKQYIPTIKFALQLISKQGNGLIEKLSGKPLEFYLVEQEYGAGIRPADNGTNWMRLMHMTEFYSIGATSFTHLANWGRVNKIVINVRKCGPDPTGMQGILHCLGHILNEDFAGQNQYWGTRSLFNNRNVQPGNSRFVLEQTALSKNISNLATFTRKCFVAEVFNFLVSGMENKIIAKENNNRAAVLRQIKAQYDWLGGPPVTWGIQ